MYRVYLYNKYMRYTGLTMNMVIFQDSLDMVAGLPRIIYVKEMPPTEQKTKHCHHNGGRSGKHSNTRMLEVT